MKTKIYTLAFFAMSIIANAQVGINTDSPTRTLDDNGNLRIRTLTDQTADKTNYNRVLVSDENGNVDAGSLQSIKNEIESQIVEIKKLKYIATTPDESKEVTCGRFTFRFGSTGQPQVKLNSAADVTIYYNQFRGYHLNSKQFIPELSLSFTTSNFNTYQDMVTNYTKNELHRFNLIYPDITNMYRIVARAMTNYTSGGTKYNSYNIVCEKF